MAKLQGQLCPGSCCQVTHREANGKDYRNWDAGGWPVIWGVWANQGHQHSLLLKPKELQVQHFIHLQQIHPASQKGPISIGWPCSNVFLIKARDRSCGSISPGPGEIDKTFLVPFWKIESNVSHAGMKTKMPSGSYHLGKKNNKSSKEKARTLCNYQLMHVVILARLGHGRYIFCSKTFF